MPKLKTKKAVLKRMRLTKTGKVRRSRAFRSHLMSGMSAKRKRKLRQPGLAKGKIAKTMAILIRPNS